MLLRSTSEVKHYKVLLVDHVFWDLTLCKVESSRLRVVTSKKIRNFVRTCENLTMGLFFKGNSLLCKNKVGKTSVAAVHFFCRTVTGKNSFWWRTDWWSLEGSDYACMPSDWSHTPQHMDICYEVNRHVLEHALACSLPPRIFVCNTHIQTTIEVHIQLQSTPRNAHGDDRGSERSSTVYELPSVFNWQVICTYVYYDRFGSVRISVTGSSTAWVSNLF